MLILSLSPAAAGTQFSALNASSFRQRQVTPIYSKDHFQRNVRLQPGLGICARRIIAGSVFEVPVGMGCRLGSGAASQGLVPFTSGRSLTSFSTLSCFSAPRLECRSAGHSESLLGGPEQYSGSLEPQVFHHKIVGIILYQEKESGSVLTTVT